MEDKIVSHTLSESERGAYVIHNMRIYSYRLSSVERHFNYEIDLKRFTDRGVNGKSESK